VLGVYCGTADVKDMSLEQIHLLEAFASQVALRIDAFHLAETARVAQLLQETDRLHSALLSSISHDLKTPLVSISGALSSLRDQAEYLDETSRKELIDGAWEESNRLHRLLVNLLDMTRLEANALPLKRIPSDIQEIIGVAIHQMKHVLVDRNIQVDVPSDLPMVETDFVLIVQVLTNLLDNAAKYSPDESPIEVTVEQHDGITVHVLDHGIGVPEDAAEKVFDKFYRADNTGSVGGAGLGLSICRGIIEAHGGRIRVENRPEGGTDIAFTLPVAETMRETV
jgi:two-component system sensor histidine kinase KdpD